MNFRLNLVVLTGLVCIVSSVALKKQQLEDDELEYYFSVKSRDLAPNHEIVLIEHVKTPYSRHHVTREAITEAKTTLRLNAFDQDVHLEMKQDSEFLAEGARVRYVDESGEIYSEEIPRDCFYRGIVRNEKDSLVTISACAGIYGAIAGSSAGPLYIEPLKAEHAMKRSMGEGLAHVVYQRSTELTQHSAYCGVKEDGSMDASDHQSSVAQHQDTRSGLPARYLKIQVLADYKVVEQRGANAQHCMEAMFHGVANRISLLPSMTASLLGITFASQTVFPTTDKSGENLGMVKTWLHAQSDNSAMDVVAGVTSTYMDNLGLAWVTAACGGNRASITFVGDMQAVEVISHEIGHNLAMGHDNGSKGCPKSGYVMAAVGTCSKCEMTWTKCSVNQYVGFAGGATCMDDP